MVGMDVMQSEQWEKIDHPGVDENDADEILSFYVGKVKDEFMKLQALKSPVSEENVDRLLSQFAFDCYRVGVMADGDHEDDLI
jgi:hypothetical protein